MHHQFILTFNTPDSTFALCLERKQPALIVFRKINQIQNVASNLIKGWLAITPLRYSILICRHFNVQLVGTHISLKDCLELDDRDVGGWIE